MGALLTHLLPGGRDGASAFAQRGPVPLEPQADPGLAPEKWSSLRYGF